jgi:hypothetical protein
LFCSRGPARFDGERGIVAFLLRFAGTLGSVV